MPILPYLFSLLTSLLTAAWAFLSAWFVEFITTVVINYLLNMLVQFIKDELLQPIEDWAKALIDDICNGIREKINVVFGAINELNETFSFFICDKFSIDYDSLLIDINNQIDNKINEYSTNLIEFVAIVFEIPLSFIDTLINLINELTSIVYQGHNEVNNAVADNINIMSDNIKSQMITAVNNINMGVNKRIEVNNALSTIATNNAGNVINTITTITDNIFNPISNFIEDLNTRVINLKQLIIDKQELLNAEIQNKTALILSTIHTFIAELITASVKEWLSLLCTQTKQVTSEIKDSLDKQKAALLELTDTANTYSKIALNNAETAMVAKVVHTTVKPHIDKITNEGVKKLEEEKLKFIKSELKDFFDINQNVLDIKQQLDNGIETEKTSHFTITDINRILNNYFNTDYRVALMLKILESDLKVKAV